MAEQMCVCEHGIEDWTAHTALRGTFAEGHGSGGKRVYPDMLGSVCQEVFHPQALRDFQP